MFSLVAVPQPCRVSPILALLHEELAEIDPRNDGAVLQRDALVPGSYLLAYVNADHLSLVLPLRQQMPGWRLLYRDEVPRAALIEAAVRVVAATLAGQLPAEQTVRPAWSKP